MARPKGVFDQEEKRFGKAIGLFFLGKAFAATSTDGLDARHGSRGGRACMTRFGDKRGAVVFEKPWSCTSQRSVHSINVGIGKDLARPSAPCKNAPW